MCTLHNGLQKEVGVSLRLLVVIGLAETATTIFAEACDDADRRASDDLTFWESEFETVGSSNPLELGIPEMPEEVGLYLWQGSAHVRSLEEPENAEASDTEGEQEECSVEYEGTWSLLAGRETLMRVIQLLHHLKEIKEGTL